MTRRLLLCVFCLFLSVAAVRAEEGPVGRHKVGEIEPLVLSTAHPYVGGIAHEFEVSHPGATYIKVHFSRFELAEGDRLVVSSSDGTERYVFRGRGYKDKGEDFWVTSVLGDRAVLRLESANPDGAYGFDVDYYAYGIAALFPTDPGNDTESVCGAQEWMDVECYAASHPTEFDRAKRAVVVLYNGVENCTGVKVGCPNQILTNEHCVTSQAEVDVTEVRFEYQRSDCNGGTTSFSEAYLGDLHIQDDFTLDYSLLTVEGASDNYEAAELDPRLPPVGERIYISGHPAGNPKKLSILDDTGTSGLCQVDLSPTAGRGTDTDVGYFCDTTGGSSGSPVWSGDTHKVIALHHFGGCPNSGVRMDLIYPEIENLLTSCCENPPNTPTLTATPNGDNRIDLEWEDSALDTVVEYLVKRSRTSGGPYDTIAIVPDTSLGMAGGAPYLYPDTDVSGGIAYYYTIEASDGDRCHSEDAPEASAQTTGACTLPPVFAGAGSVTSPASQICTLDVVWQPAVAECGGPLVYNLYRSPDPDFEPSGANLLAAGLPTTSFQDINQLTPTTVYYYTVRAVDTANGVEEDNSLEVAGQTAAGCTTASACPENPYVNVTPDGPQTVCQNGGPTLTADLTGGAGPFHYTWLRDGQAVPGEAGPTYTPNELGTHSYNVRVRADACPDEVFDGIDTELTRVNQPFFGGIGSALNPQDATCTVELAWNSATTVCAGPVDYAIFRSQTSPVEATPQNLVAGGVTGTSYVDHFDLMNEESYHYRVLARDLSTGQFDGNAVEASAAPDGPNNGLQQAFADDFEDLGNFAQWTVTTGPGVHNCGEWQVGTASGKRPSGGSGNYMIADNECGGLLPRTSTIATSPVVDVVLGGIQAVSLSMNLRYEHSSANGDEDGSVEVWDGAQWVPVWTDTNSNYNQLFTVDVSAYALGNPAFQVRVSYQNAAADRFFSVDNFEVITDVVSPCATEAAGPSSVPASVTVGRAPGVSDTLEIGWDAASCPASDYNLLYGDLANAASYGLLGSVCSIGTTGAHTWSAVPGGNLYFLLVGTDGAGTESSWGHGSGWVERNGNAASNQCGAAAKDATALCP